MDELPDTPAKVPSPLTPVPLLLRPRTPARLEPIPSPTTPKPEPVCWPYTPECPDLEELPQTPVSPSPLTPVPPSPLTPVPLRWKSSPLTPIPPSPALDWPHTPVVPA